MCSAFILSLISGVLYGVTFAPVNYMIVSDRSIDYRNPPLFLSGPGNRQQGRSRLRLLPLLRHLPHFDRPLPRILYLQVSDRRMIPIGEYLL